MTKISEYAFEINATNYLDSEGYQRGVTTTYRQETRGTPEETCASGTRIQTGQIRCFTTYYDGQETQNSQLRKLSFRERQKEICEFYCKPLLKELKEEEWSLELFSVLSTSEKNAPHFLLNSFENKQ